MRTLSYSYHLVVVCHILKQVLYIVLLLLLHLQCSVGTRSFSFAFFHCILTCYSQLPQMLLQLKAGIMADLLKICFQAIFNHDVPAGNCDRYVHLTHHASLVINLIPCSLHCESYTLCIHFPTHVKVCNYTRLQIKEDWHAPNNHLLFVVAIRVNFINAFVSLVMTNHYKIQLLRVLLLFLLLRF